MTNTARAYIPGTNFYLAYCIKIPSNLQPDEIVPTAKQLVQNEEYPRAFNFLGKHFSQISEEQRYSAMIVVETAIRESINEIREWRDAAIREHSDMADDWETRLKEWEGIERTIFGRN